MNTIKEIRQLANDSQAQNPVTMAILTYLETKFPEVEKKVAAKKVK